jgi:hypothetical protein
MEWGRVDWRWRLQAPGIAQGYWTPDVPLVPSEVRERGDFGEQLNSGHAAASVERVRRVPGSRTHRLFFIPDLAADDSPPAERSCATGRRIW